MTGLVSVNTGGWLGRPPVAETMSVMVTKTGEVLIVLMMGIKVYLVGSPLVTVISSTLVTNVGSPIEVIGTAAVKDASPSARRGVLNL